MSVKLTSGFPEPEFAPLPYQSRALLKYAIYQRILEPPKKAEHAGIVNVHNKGASKCLNSLR